MNTLAFNADGLAALPKHDRIRLINGLVGARPAHLLGTRSAAGVDNLALFNSAQHVGSDPALISVLFRPLEADCGVERHSHSNLIETGHYSLNAVTPALLPAAHNAAAKYPVDHSEFAALGLTPERLEGFVAPFVAGSPIQIGLRYVEQHRLCNATVLVVGAIEHLRIAAGGLTDDHAPRPAALDALNVVGLDHYHSLVPHQRLGRPSRVG